MKNEEYTYLDFQGLPLNVSLYRCQSNPLNKTVLYFHGGGLVYGSRQDMSTLAIQRFLDAGYHFMAVDYPLAPESGIDDILFSVKEAVRYFRKEATNTLSLNSSDFILFGRSAGAYLCFLIAGDQTLPDPDCIIDFYGYDSLSYKEFQESSPHYSAYPRLNEQVVKRIIQHRPIANGPIQTRFALYIYARQTGKWVEFLKLNHSPDRHYSLEKKSLNGLPPTFIAHSTRDTDVPFRIAKKLEQEIPVTHLHSVDHNEHDFDRDSQSELSKHVYSELFDWLKQIK